MGYIQAIRAEHKAGKLRKQGVNATVGILNNERHREYAEVDPSIKCDFAMSVKGDSMIGACIKDGYTVFFHKQPTVEDGEIAAVMLDDVAALKRVRHLPGGMTILEACNPKYDPIFIGGDSNEHDFQILGKAVAFQGY